MKTYYDQQEKCKWLWLSLSQSPYICFHMHCYIAVLEKQIYMTIHILFCYGNYLEFATLVKLAIQKEKHCLTFTSCVAGAYNYTHLSCDESFEYFLFFTIKSIILLFGFYNFFKDIREKHFFI